MIHTVVVTRSAQRDLKTVPEHIRAKFLAWVSMVEIRGLEVARQVPGYNDEALKGQRKGQRSIRLSRAYRAIYEVLKDGGIELVSVEEINKHEY